MSRPLSRIVAASRQLGLMALLLAACQSGPPTGAVRLAVSSPPGPVARISVTSSGPELPAASIDLERNGNVWGGVLGAIPAGNDRTFQAQAFDAAGTLLFQGQTSGVQIVADQVVLVAIYMQELSPPPPYTNEAPVIDSLVASPITVTAGGTVQLTAAAHDPNQGDTLSVSWSADTGAFADPAALDTGWSAPTTPGIVSLTLTVTDSQQVATSLTVQVNVVAAGGGEGSAQIDIQFNTSPVITRVLANPTRFEPGQLSQVSVTASDPDGDSLTYSWASDCPGYFPYGGGAASQFIPFGLPPGACNNCRLHVTVTDSRGASTTGTLAVCIALNSVQRFPPSVVRTYQSSLNVLPGQTVTFGVTASDPQGSSLSFGWGATAGVLGNAASPDAVSSRTDWTAPNCAGSLGAPTVTATVTNAYGLSVARTFTITGLPPCAGGGQLDVIAGQYGGAGSLDGTGTSARFNNPGGAVYDGAGVLYVADTSNYTIRKVVLATGAVTTFAGRPGGYGLLDGVGAAARFANPQGLALDGAGNLYVADANTIRKVALATAEVTTIAGSPYGYGSIDGIGPSASFTSAEALALDGAGHLYVADGYGNTIRRVDLATAEVTTIAGSPYGYASIDGIGASAGFANPRGIAYDGAGNLFVADAGSNVLRKIVIATAEVTTVAGNAYTYGAADGIGPAALFVNPRGLVADGAGNLYIADYGNYTVRKMVIATAEVTTVAGAFYSPGSTDGIGSAARFYYPTGLALGAGSLFVTDGYNQTLRQVAVATGQVTTLAGRPPVQGNVDGIGVSARFSAPAGAASDGAGNLFVVDGNNRVIRQITVATGRVTTLAGNPYYYGNVDGIGTNAAFANPAGIAYDGAGTLFVADPGSNTIRRIVIATREVTTLAGSPYAYGNIDGIGPAAAFGNPQELTADGAGNVYVADSGNRTVRKIVVATGEVTTLAGNPYNYGDIDGIGANAGFSYPYAITTDRAGHLFVVDRSSQTLRKIGIASGEVTTLAGIAYGSGSDDGIGAAARFSSPQGVAYDGAGNLYVADAGNHALRRVAIATGEVTTVLGRSDAGGVSTGPIASATLNAPRGLAFVVPGILAIAEQAENSILVASGL
ncbi:MAG TPA: hypothetical protein VH877_00875 [Polyangia bacterium]|nr:hypothetical protein [Polyangia bacterium]